MSTSPLERPLPPELVSALGGLMSYLRYPPFTRPWLLRRTTLIVLVLGAFSTLVALGTWTQTGTLSAAASTATSMFVGGLTITTAGPLLATLVRHRGWRLPRERVGVVTALILGAIIASVGDAVASAIIQRHFPEPPPVDVSGVESGVAWVINVLVLAVIYGLLGGGLAVQPYLAEPARRAELERARELAELRARHHTLDAQLGVLQAQIEPHFLFNTLASLRSLITHDAALAVEALDALVEYLRASIPKLRADQLESTLGSQLELVSAYLRLMRARTGRLSFSVDSDPALATMPFPPLLLLSLVENAVKHGLEPKPGPVHVAVRVARDGERVHIEVVDDGAGLAGQLGVGVGLHNVREQLRVRYGDRARLTLEGARGGGAHATISIEAP